MILYKKRSYFIGAILILLTCVSLFFYRQHKITTKKNRYDCCPVFFADAPICFNNKLNDKNDIHLIYAKKNGLKRALSSNKAFDAEVDKLSRKFILVKVGDNQFFKLKTLTHSRPYLIPEAIDMLNEIGYRFQEKLKEKKYPMYKFCVTSLLRTEDEQNKLSRRNSNATNHSSHLYGTTVDISYKDFYRVDKAIIESSYEAVQTLTSVLIEMREECKFLAIRERKQSCFHITVVLCRPNGVVRQKSQQ